jgi:sulfate transport system permease protein
VSGATLVRRRHRVIPGFGITMGMTLLWLSLIVLIPLAALFLKTTELSFDRFVRIITSQRVLHALELSFGLSLAAAAVNIVFGFAVVWALVRYQFPGRRLFDAIVDIPFALPTAVAGIALTNLYSENGWLGRLLAPLGIQVAFTPLGIFVALVFVGLPFVVRTVQPVLEDLEAELAASSFQRSCRPSSRALRSPSRARSASTARSFSSPAICRTCRRSRRS